MRTEKDGQGRNERWLIIIKQINHSDYLTFDFAVSVAGDPLSLCVFCISNIWQLGGSLICIFHLHDRTYYVKRKHAIHVLHDVIAILFNLALFVHIVTA